MRLPLTKLSVTRLSVTRSALLFLFLAVPAARAASSHDDQPLDAAGLVLLEARAEQADPREQCFLFTELVHFYIEAAGQQMAAGDMDQASTTLHRVQHFADRIHVGLARDSKRVKRAEMLMHTASHNLGLYLHLVSTEDQAVVTATVAQLNKVNEELLAQVFAH